MILEQKYSKTSMKYSASLDADFMPAILVEKHVSTSPKIGTLYGALLIDAGSVFRFEVPIFEHPLMKEVVHRRIQFLLWSVGGYELQISGPTEICQQLRQDFQLGGARHFDVEIMERIFERPFQVAVLSSESELSEQASNSQSIGNHLDGCRLGFDLGASDFKLTAVENGEVKFSDEVPWTPVEQSDPEYHWNLLQQGLERAAKYLPRVDAIGGSSAGIIRNNRVRVASLFRSVPREEFEKKVSTLFERLQKKWNVPMMVVNDGDVSALAGGMSLNATGIMGLAMGSSEAVGFLDRQGGVTGYLNELAFAPIDYNVNAAVDEWSGAKGLGVQYFSQQAVNKLALSAGMTFSQDMRLPERLKEVQALANGGDALAEKIYQSIGVYLGYTVPYYAQFYDFEQLMIFGRVTSGTGGEIILSEARKILKEEFSNLDLNVAIPDEKFRRVGQAVAAASLPKIK